MSDRSRTRPTARVVLVALALASTLGVSVAAPERGDAATRRTTTTKRRTTTTKRAAVTSTTTIPSTTTVAGTALTVSPRAYVDAVFDHIAKVSIRRRVVDIEALRAQTIAATAGAVDTSGTYAAIRKALAALGDPHAGLFEPNQSRALLQGSATGFGVQLVTNVLFVIPGSPAEKAGLRDGDVVVDYDGKPFASTRLGDLGDTVRFGVLRDGVRVEVVVTKGPVTTSYVPKVRALDDRLALLELPGATGSREDQLRFMATAVDGVAALDGPRRCGWVLDLRRNTGGFPYVTLAALAPLSGDGIVGGSVDVDDVVTRWSVREGSVFVGDQKVETARAYHLVRADAAVAVLTSTLTASAGERATLAIVGRGANRSFGAPTAGLASSTLLQPFVDGSSVAVTTSFDVDRFGVTYPGPIAPDEPVALDWTRFGRADDPVLGAAMTWLRAQAACAGA